MKPIVEQLTKLQSEVEQAMTKLDLDSDKQKLASLEAEMSESTFWNNPDLAETASKEASQLREYIDGWQNLYDELTTTLELAQLAKPGDETEYDHLLKQLSDRVEQALIAVQLNGPYDKLPAIIQLSAGVGGTDAADWTQMLEKMYLRYAEKSGLNVEILDESPAEEAGIKSATLRFTGPFAYGKLRSEKGSHRLVRQSPFNSDKLRQTSFALVDVIPEIPPQDANLDEKDLKIDTYRSSGHGGQSVNTTDSAVRITHVPTGLVVSIQNERSQLKNKQRAMSILASRLSEMAREQHLASISELRGKVKSADWGSQIRSYVLHPYQKVKDHRTNYETADTAGVLDGNIEPFIEAYLKSQVGS